MAKRIALTGTANMRIVLKDTATRRLSAPNVGDRLGAEVVGAAAARAAAAPLRAVRREPLQRLKSIGGRAGLVGAERKKIPFTQRD